MGTAQGPDYSIAARAQNESSDDRLSAISTTQRSPSTPETSRAGDEGRRGEGDGSDKIEERKMGIISGVEDGIAHRRNSEAEARCLQVLSRGEAVAKGPDTLRRIEGGCEERRTHHSNSDEDHGGGGAEKISIRRYDGKAPGNAHRPNSEAAGLLEGRIVGTFYQERCSAVPDEEGRQAEPASKISKAQRQLDCYLNQEERAKSSTLRKTIRLL